MSATIIIIVNRRLISNSQSASFNPNADLTTAVAVLVSAICGNILTDQLLQTSYLLYEVLLYKLTT